MELDNVLKKIGEFGPFQRRVYFTVCLIMFPAAFSSLGYVFWAARLDHWCHVDKPSGLENISDEVWKNWTIPVKDVSTPTGARYDSCSRFDLSEDVMLAGKNGSSGTFEDDHWVNRSGAGARKVLPCDSWDYDTQQYTSSIVSQYTLVCERQWLISMTQSLYMASRVVGTLGLGALADKFGRRPIILISVLLQVTSAVAIAFAPNIESFIALRSLVAIFSTGSLQAIYVLVMEIVGPKWRVFAGTVIMIYWAVAYMLLGIIAYFMHSHFTLMIVTSVPTVSLLIFYWIVPESPRWLLVNNKKNAALAIIKKMAKTNGNQLLDAVDYDIIVVPKVKSPAIKSSLCETLRSPYILRMTAVLTFIWFTSSVVYYGLSLNTSDLGGNDHFNFIIAGAVEVPAYVICFVTFHRFGRQWPLAVVTLLTGCSLLATAAVPADNFITIVVLATFGKFAITCTYSMIYIYTTELFPTSVRNITFGICSTASRLGGTLAPFAAELSRFYPGTPLIIFGILATVASVLVLTLPETKDTSLPQTLEDGRRLAQQPNVFSRCLQTWRKKVTVTEKNLNPEEETLSDTKI